MNGRSFLKVFAVALGLTMASGPAFSGTTDPKDAVEALAFATMSKLMAGDPAGAIGQIHEPPAWDKAHIVEDRRKVAKGFAALLKEFGKVSSPRVAGSVSFYELQLAGADVSYWQALPNFGIDSRVTYLVNFSKAGPGVVVVSFTRASGSWELRSISLGLERGRSRSRETMLRIGRIFVGRMDPQMPRDKIDVALEQMFGPERP